MAPAMEATALMHTPVLPGVLRSVPGAVEIPLVLHPLHDPLDLLELPSAEAIQMAQAGLTKTDGGEVQEEKATAALHCGLAALPPGIPRGSVRERVNHNGNAFSGRHGIGAPPCGEPCAPVRARKTAPGLKAVAGVLAADCQAASWAIRLCTDHVFTL